ncbi:hypothetical protein A1Q2_05535 [Trichosporon asahii var. asahii CBS 8904]|uniref:Uncharacterized protein n=1 Tax=Trichosporon asahii var. asahii (strain CBS 8904) TaxID=1220162 RepID=K1VLL9_TRIAC|nr:hypothetical protein A1Q2_05535 [Trichosporon asahii var. asahii CBS 8904]
MAPVTRSKRIRSETTSPQPGPGDARSVAPTTRSSKRLRSGAASPQLEEGVREKAPAMGSSKRTRSGTAITQPESPEGPRRRKGARKNAQSTRAAPQAPPQAPPPTVPRAAPPAPPPPVPPAAPRKRTIPAELLSTICGHLFDDGAIGTLNAIMRTGPLGYTVVGPVLYSTLVVDDSFAAVLEGLGKNGRKRALFWNVRHIFFAATDTRAMVQCIARIVGHVAHYPLAADPRDPGPGPATPFATVDGETEPLFPNLHSVSIESRAFVPLALNPDSPALFLKMFCRPSVGKTVHQSFRDLTPQEPEPGFLKRMRFSDIAADGLAGRKGLDRLRRAQIRYLRAKRARAMAEVLGNPVALEDLLRLWNPETVTLHGFRFFHPGMGEWRTGGRGVDFLSWAQGRVRIFAPTVGSEHPADEGGQIPGIPGFQCRRKVGELGRRCACNQLGMWRRAAKFLGSVHVHSFPPNPPNGPLPPASRSAISKPTLELCNVGQNLPLWCGCRYAYTAAIQNLKTYVRGEGALMARLEEGMWTRRQDTTRLAYHLEIPHWSEVEGCACGLAGVQAGHDAKEPLEAGVLQWFEGDADGKVVPREQGCTTPHPFDEREVRSNDWVNDDSELWEDDGDDGYNFDRNPWLLMAVPRPQAQRARRRRA